MKHSRIQTGILNRTLRGFTAWMVRGIHSGIQVRIHSRGHRGMHRSIQSSDSHQSLQMVAQTPLQQDSQRDSLQDSQQVLGSDHSSVIRRTARRMLNMLRSKVLEGHTSEFAV